MRDGHDSFPNLKSLAYFEESRTSVEEHTSLKTTEFWQNTACEGAKLALRGIRREELGREK